MLAGWQPTQMIVNELWHSRAFTSSAARSYSLQYPTGVSVVVADLCFACFVAMVEVGPVWALLYRQGPPKVDHESFHIGEKIKFFYLTNVETAVSDGGTHQIPTVHGLFRAVLFTSC